jgi:surface protein
MSQMFANATSFNQPLNNWNVSNATNMSEMFDNATSFNQPLNNWNVSNVTNMSEMFYNATSFNQPLNNWNVSNVTNMSYMFKNATSFNQPLNNWNVSNVTNMSQMFKNATSFNQPLNNWNISNVQEGREEIMQRITTPIVSSTETIKNEDMGYDAIYSGTDVNIKEYLKEEPENIIFKFHNQYYLSNKNDIKNSIIPNKSNIKYGCREVGTTIIPRRENVILDKPYLSLNSIGIPSGLVLLFSIKTVLQDDSIKALEIVGEPIEKLVSTTSQQMLEPNANAVGASHCQEGQEANVYEIKNIIINLLEGGRSRKKRKTIKKRKTMKKIKKRKTIKKKTKKTK